MSNERDHKELGLDEYLRGEKDWQDCLPPEFDDKIEDIAKSATKDGTSLLKLLFSVFGKGK